jgi:O-antigen ligase
VHGKTDMNPMSSESFLAPSGYSVLATGSIRARRLDLFGRSAFVFLWLFVFSVPWLDGFLIPGFGTGARIIGVVAFGLGVLGIVERAHLEWPSAGFQLLTLFAVWSSATYFWSINPEATAERVSTYCQLLALAFLISQFCSGRQRFTWLIQAYLLGTVVASLSTIVNYYLNREAVYQRYATTGYDANDLGVTLALSLPFSYQMSVASRGARRWLYRLHLVLAITAILLTASRGALVTSLVALGIVPVTALLRGSRAVAATLVAGGIVFGAVCFVVPVTSWERLSTITTDATEGTMGDRRMIWKAGLEVLPSHPLVGVGSGAYEDSVAPIIGRPNTVLPNGVVAHFVAHNTYLSILVECGLVGFSIMVALVVVIFGHVAALPRASRIAWIFCLLAFATGTGLLTWENRKPTWVLLSLCLVESARRARAPHIVARMNRGRTGMTRRTVLSHAASQMGG